MPECVLTDLVMILPFRTLPHENWAQWKMAMNYDNLNGGEMDTSDSRKRPLDTEVDNGVPKRSNQGGG